MTLKSLPFVDPGTPDLRGPGAFLRWLARQQWRVQSLGVLYGVLWMSAQAAVPAVLGLAVGAAVRGETRTVVVSLLAIAALGVVQTATSVLRHRIAVEVWITAASRTQQLVARRASDLGADLSAQVATGEVVAVTASDVEKIGSAFDVLARFSGAVVAFIGVAVALLVVSPSLGAVVLVGVPLFALAVGPLLKPLERRESAQRAKLGTATELASDTVAGLRVLRGIGGEELFLDRFRAASQEVRVAAFATARIRSLLDALQVALPGAFVVAVTWLGARAAVAGSISIGELIAFYGWTAFLVMPLRTVTEAAHKWTRARVAATRVVRVLSVQPVEVADTPEPLADAIAPGILTAVVSARPDDQLAARLGRALGALVQDTDPVLLSGSVAALLDVPRSGRVSALSALSTAAADDVLQSLAEPGADPADLDVARLTERGRTLSGGQRQRLALARSLRADPPVLVLDEPTSAVDAHTEARLARSIRTLREGRTTVILTTSPLLLEHADRVAFLGVGSIRTGTHHELLHDLEYLAVVTRASAQESGPDDDAVDRGARPGVDAGTATATATATAADKDTTIDTAARNGAATDRAARPGASVLGGDATSGPSSDPHDDIREEVRA